MKLIILAAGRTNTTNTQSDPPPKCLRRFDESSTVLDRIVAAGRAAGCSQVVVVGGYQILSIMEAYPSFKYYYNPEWERSASLVSLLQAEPELTEDVLVAYSDVVYDPVRTASLVSTFRGPAVMDLVVATDSAWKTRYEGRTPELLQEAEKLFRLPGGSLVVTRRELTGFEGGAPELLGEFAGIFALSRAAIPRAIGAARRIIADDLTAGIGDLVAALSSELPAGRTGAFDFEGAWAELDTEQDLARFRFGTKAETLERLRVGIQSARVLPQQVVRVDEWRVDPSAVLDRVRHAFSGSVAVRSSALNEDTEHASLAGNYESVLDVPVTDDAAISSAIERVCESYSRKDGSVSAGDAEIGANQILIQPMLHGVTLSGVAFTADLETGAPYYTINYDRSGSTESITSGNGAGHRTLVYYKHAMDLPVDPELAAVVQTLREIELLTGYSSLDVEFAVRGPEAAPPAEGAPPAEAAPPAEGASPAPEVVIFQVRPIAAHKERLRVSADDVGRELAHVARYLELDREDRTVLSGGTCAWGVMPDWNPAEIIGINPRPLAFSLYRAIITDDVWGRSRVECGYRSTRPRPGIVDFAGKPYVDIRMSFTSFTPAALPDNLADLIVEGAVNHLLAHPELHDKVEFSVMPTVFDLDFDSVLDSIAERGAERGDGGQPTALTRDDRAAILEAYRALTDRIVSSRGISVAAELTRIERLTARRERVSGALSEGRIAPAAALSVLLDDCREFGTLPFSNLARFAFVGIIQLKALVRRVLLSQDRVDSFLASIQTVAKEFVHDLATMDRDGLVTRYGHLRPGTYDITSPAYHEAFDRYVDLDHRPESEPLPRFDLTPDENDRISRDLSRAGFSIDAQQLFAFVRAAVQGRERGKFEFTRNLSLAIDLISDLAEREGLSREEASYLTLDEIMVLAGGSRPSGLAKLWRSIVERRTSRHLVTTAIKFPPVISRPADLTCFEISDESPNYITRKALAAPVHVLHGMDFGIEGSIVLIEHADPGFDWIFSHGIAALVTRFGGANSHMAIRCAEFEIPAAIGCGEAIFDRLSRARTARIDCAARRLEVIG